MQVGGNDPDKLDDPGADRALPDLDDPVREVLSTIRAVGTDLTTVEVKAGAGGLPKSIVETASAFANTDGGVIILGLDETTDFAPIEIDAGKLASDLASACADQLDPPIRPHIDLVDIEGHTFVAAIVDSNRGEELRQQAYGRRGRSPLPTRSSIPTLIPSQEEGPHCRQLSTCRGSCSHGPAAC